MKPALVFGLALAANAMAADSTDNNELFVAPQGKLADLAKRYPGMIMFDEQADDEFYKGNLPREAFKSDEEYRRYIVKRSAEEGDDEFLVRPLSADDEELFVAPAQRTPEMKSKFFKTRGDFNNEYEWQRYRCSLYGPCIGKTEKIAYDDDELAAIIPQRPEDNIRNGKNYLDNLYRINKNFKNVARDDAAADELAAITPQRPEHKNFMNVQNGIDSWYRINKENLQKLARDDAADDEFFSKTRGLFKTESEWRSYIASVTTPPSGKAAVREAVRVGIFGADDEELFFAPVQRLGNLAQARPTLMLDEIADDELRTYQKTAVREAVRIGIFGADDAADDELGLKIVRFPTANHLAYAFDDDELVAIRIPREKFPTEEAYRRYQVSLSEEVADDELLATNQFNQQNGTIRIPNWQMQGRDDELMTSKESGQYNSTIIFPGWASRTRDDELLTSKESGQYNSTIRFPGWATQTWDDEGKTIESNQEPRVIYIPSYWIKTKDDNVADEELAVKIVNLPAVENGNVAFDDDELAFRAPRVFIDRPLTKPTRNHTIETTGHKLVKPVKDLTNEALVSRDDEADDELLYLGQLIKDQVRGFDDDEFRAKGEKPSHVKIQEMGTEGPKMKRKLRPVVDGQN